MDRKQLEIVSIQNISNYDFPFVDHKANNHIMKTTRMPGETMGDERVYMKPDVPVLMWDGEVYELNAGQVKQFPRFLAEHFAGKIIDRFIIDQTPEGVEGNNNKKSRAELLKRIFMEDVVAKPVVAPVEEVQEEVKEIGAVAGIATNEMAMGQLRQLAKQKGLKYPPTTSRSSLVNMINATTGTETTE